jgi:[ribosomal protein S18]-alanine N-acetyltransferase
MTALTAAGPGHAAAMAALHAAAFPPAERWDAHAFATQLALPGGFGFLAGDQGMVLARHAADEAEILTIAVVPAARRAGLGARLLRAAEAYAISQGARKMFLEVAPDNLPAAELYGAAGYLEVGRRRRYYPDGSDALVLARRLTPGAATAE